MKVEMILVNIMFKDLMRNKICQINYALYNYEINYLMYNA